MTETIARFSGQSITRRGGLWLWRRHCESDEEFAELQAVRGYLSGLARRARTARRDRAILSSRRAGMKVFAIAMRFCLSVAQISRIVARQKGEAAKQYPHVPTVLSRLFHGVLVPRNTLYANRLSRQNDRIEDSKIREREERYRTLASRIRDGTVTVTDECPSCGLRHRQLDEMQWCASCGLRLRY